MATEPQSAQSLRYKIVLRLVVGPGGYLAELDCRGSTRRFEGGPKSSDVETARAGLGEALAALKAACAIECFLDESIAEALEGALDHSPHAHQLQPYFLSHRDDPSLNAMHRALCAKKA